MYGFGVPGRIWHLRGDSLIPETFMIATRETNGLLLKERDTDTYAKELIRLYGNEQPPANLIYAFDEVQSKE